MSIHTIVPVVSIVAIAFAVFGTGWSLARLRYDQGSPSLEYLTELATPTKKAINVAQIFAGSCLAIAFALDYIDDPKGMRPALVLLAVAAAVPPAGSPKMAKSTVDSSR